LLQSSLCIIGIDGLGAELAKNCLLAGVSKLFLCDDEFVSKLDISTNLCLRHKSFDLNSQRTRAEECESFLHQFNPAADISTFRDFNSEFYKKFSPDLVVICNKVWSESQKLAKECRDNNIPVIVAFTGGLYYLFALDLGEHSYVDVQENKQEYFPLTETTEITPSGEESSERVFQAVYSDDSFPLEESDVVELFIKSGEKVGIATVKSIDFEKCHIVLSSRTPIEEEIFIHHLPQTKTCHYPSLEEVTATSSAMVPLLAKGLQAWDRFLSTCEDKSIRLPRSQAGFEDFFRSVVGATDENKHFFQRFYDTSFATTIPVSSIVGGIISEQVMKVII